MNYHKKSNFRTVAKGFTTADFSAAHIIQRILKEKPMLRQHLSVAKDDDRSIVFKQQRFTKSFRIPMEARTWKDLKSTTFRMQATIMKYYMLKPVKIGKVTKKYSKVRHEAIKRFTLQELSLNILNNFK